MLRFVSRLATVFVLAGVVVFTRASGAVANNGDVAFKPTFEAAKCPVALPAGVRDGVDVRCGYVTVPERHARPDSKTIQIAVAVINAAGERTVADPIVFLDGGPGFSSLANTLPLLAGPFGQPLRDTGRDVVMFEQRGNFYSRPALTCPEVSAAFTRANNADLGIEARRGDLVTAYGECRDRLKARGVNLSAYNGVENAADIPMIVKALGYDRYNVYAVSYGTQLAQHLLRDHPDGVRSVVLNAVMPMDTNVNASIPASAQRAFSLLFEACRKDAACNMASPRLEAEFNAFVTRLNASPLKLAGRSFTGDDVVRLLSEEFASESLPEIPDKVRNLIRGDTSWLASRAGASAATGTEALGTMYSTICAEDADFTRNDLRLDTPIERAMAAGRPAEMLAVCGIWGVERLPPLVDDAVVTAAPALLMAGEFDVITPPEFLPLAAAGMSKSYRYRYPATGHGGIDICRLSMTLAFIEDPSKAPGDSCIREMSLTFSPALPAVVSLQAR